MPILEGTVDNLLKALRKMARTASDEGILMNQPHEIFDFIKKSEVPSEAEGIPGARAIIGGEKNQRRSMERKHFLRADGAWFDFTITVARRRTGTTGASARWYCAPDAASSDTPRP